MVTGPRLKGYGALGLVFLLGLAAGAGGAYAYAEQRYAEVLGGGRSEWMERRRVHALSDRLNLNSDQRGKVRTIFEKYHSKRHDLTREMYERCGAPLRDQDAELRAEINALLTPEQQKLHAEIESRHGGHFQLGGGSYGRHGGRETPAPSASPAPSTSPSP